ncbi:MAG: type II toxin-antitoxin system HicA family toxin [Leptolyngbyaceae cyanobacterium RM1_406_9]|nr:type II toxin-antitoxin system HicA family toxin [Leptolyngbyaceae cyanobacterium RM1_406_9]
MPKKIRVIKKLLLDAGFTWRPGKGSHSFWTYPLLTEPIVIARKDGDDAPLYLEKQVNNALAQLKEMGDSEK